jgi:hypothetical protein
MSSTSRGGVREVDDFYETQPEAAVPMIDRLRGTSLPSAPVIVEPMAGRGALVRLLREAWPKAVIIANELNEERAGELERAGADVVLRGNMFRQGFRREVIAAAGGRTPHLAFTNPAFSLAQECQRDLVAWCPRVDLLQRLGWLGSQDRLPFWVQQRYDLGILAQRPSFAASLSCGKVEGRGKQKVKRPCGWAVVQYLDAPRHETCPGCRGAGIESPVNCSTSDSADYAWYDFYAESLNQHFHLGRVETAQQGTLAFGEAS